MAFWEDVSAEYGVQFDDAPADAPAAEANTGGGDPALVAKLEAYRAQGGQQGVRVDESDARVYADPDFQRWQPGTAIYADRTQSSSGGGVTAPAGVSPTPMDPGAPRPISAFTEQFNRPTMEQVKSSEPFKFRLGESIMALERSAAARGKLRAGLGKDVIDYAQQAASEEYEKEYGRASSEFDRRFGIHRANEGDRFNTERTNRMDTYGIGRSDRMDTHGIGQDLWNRGRTDRMDTFAIDQDQWYRGNTEENQRYGRLFQLAGLGDPVRAEGVNAGYTGAATDARADGANASAAGQVGAANAWSNALGSVVPLAQSYYLSRALQRPTGA